MERSIFQIANESTIVFSAPDADTLISINSSGLYWWFAIDDGKYYLTDSLYVNHNLHIISINYAKKLAEDWFESSLNESVGDNENDDSDCSITTEYSIIADSVNEIPKVEPPFLNSDKKDAHTEHCCIDHNRCKFNNKNCTVVSGRKKQSYPCKCSN